MGNSIERTILVPSVIASEACVEKCGKFDTKVDQAWAEAGKNPGSQMAVICPGTGRLCCKATVMNENDPTWYQQGTRDFSVDTLTEEAEASGAVRRLATEM